MFSLFFFFNNRISIDAGLKNFLATYNCVKYSGGYDKEEKAARSYDLAALKYWGPTATTNFPVIYSLKYPGHRMYFFVFPLGL